MVIYYGWWRLFSERIVHLREFTMKQAKLDPFVNYKVKYWLDRQNKNTLPEQLDDF